MNHSCLKICALACAAIVAASAAAQVRGGKFNYYGFLNTNIKRLRIAKDPIQVRPIAVAKVDAGMNHLTPWQPMVQDNDWPGGPWFTVFDAAEISPADPGSMPPAPNGRPYENPAYGPAYMVPPNFGLTSPAPGARFYGGPNYNDPFATNDMEMHRLYAGFETQRVAFGWYWNPTNPTERMIVGLSTAETFADTVAGFPPPPMGGPNNLSYEGFLGGVVFDFGDNMGAGYQPGFYFANIDVSAGTNPLDFPSPVDAKGAYIMTILSSTTPPTLASRAQPMNWMTKQTNYGQPGGNPSRSIKWQWDDDLDIATGDNIPDGRHLTDPPGPANRVELYDYDPFTPDPIVEPLGIMTAFYSSYGAYTAQAAGDIVVQLGEQLGGTFQSLFYTDNDAFVIICDEFTPNGRVVVTVDTPNTSVQNLSLILATGSSRPDITEFVDLFNFSTNTFNNVNNRVVSSPGRTEFRIDVTNPANYLGPNGQVVVRYRWIPQTDSAAYDGWSYAIERHTVFIR